jgi:hypothetical protein
MRRVVLETTRVGRIVRRGNNDTVCKTRRPSVVVGEDGVRDHRGGSIFLAPRQHDIDTIRSQNLKRAVHRRLRQCMGVDSEK